MKTFSAFSNLLAALFLISVMAFVEATPDKMPFYYWLNLVMLLLNMLVFVGWVAKKTMP